MRKQNIFVVHATRSDIAADFIEAVRRKFLEVNIISLSREITFGEPVPLELERISSEMDAAIIIATADDVGGEVSGTSFRPRSRQNVWLEVGWFWGRIGRKRTLILRQAKVEMPSDTEGVYAPVFEQTPNELMGEIEKFISLVSEGNGQDINEIVYSSSNSDVRLSQFNEVIHTAKRELWISGIGMNTMRHTIHKIAVAKMLGPTDFKLNLLTPNPDFVRDSYPKLSTIYRKNLWVDIETFSSAVESLQIEFPSIASEVELRQYSGVMPFVITAADPRELGGAMIAELLPPLNPTIHTHERPRFYLRRRSHRAVYESFWASFLTMWKSARRPSS